MLTEELKGLVGSELENDVENLKEDVLAVCLLTFQKVNVTVYKIKRRHRKYITMDRTRMGMFCNLKKLKQNVLKVKSI